MTEAVTINNDRGRIVLLILRRQTLALVEDKAGLGRRLPLLRLRNWGDEFRAAAGIDNALCRLATLIKLPVAPRIAVWRVQYRLVKKWVPRIGPFASAEKAARMCSGLKAAGGDCIIQKN